MHFQEIFRKNEEVIRYLEGFCNKKRIRFYHEEISPSFNKEGSKCYACSREKRKRLFEIAEEKGVKKIALGHHKEDVVESLLMNLFFNREIATMKIKQDFFGGKFFIIRPLYFFTEEDIEEYTRKKQIKVIENKCPYENENKRLLIRRLIQELKKIDRKVLDNILVGVTNVNRVYFPFDIFDFSVKKSKIK